MRIAPSTIALAVWNLVAVASRTVTVSGTVTVGTNNDKTGYSLTAGSYSVRASSSQRGTTTMTTAGNNTSAISSVTTTRAGEMRNGQRSNRVGNDAGSDLCSDALTSATVITVQHDNPVDTLVVYWVVQEFV